MKTQAIVPAAGSGQRLKFKIPKPLVLLKSKPLIVYCLEKFQKCSLIDSVILVVQKKYLARFKSIIKNYRLTKVVHVIGGGKTRRDSVVLGLKVLDKDTDFILVHDGARPFIEESLIERTIAQAAKHQAVIASVPVKPTIKQVNCKKFIVEKTLERSTLWEVQTPQVFKKDILIKAHAQPITSEITDDAALVEKLGIDVHVVMGDYRNIKITTPEDLVLAEALLDSRN